VWRFYSTLAGEQIYSQPPFSLNTDQFPPTRYSQVDKYGLEISGVDWKDGGIYGCHFLSANEHHLIPVVIIGQLLLLNTSASFHLLGLVMMMVMVVVMIVVVVVMVI